MPEQPIDTTGSEVQTFIENTLNQIKEGVKKSGFRLKEGVDFELDVTEKKESGVSGGFKQFIQIGKKKEGESTQKVKFSAKPDTPIRIESI